MTARPRTRASSTSSASAGTADETTTSIPLLQVRAVVALGHMDAEALEPAGVLRRRRIAAVDLGTPGVGDRGEGRHPGAADADHVQAPLGKARHRASSRSVVAIRSAASGRASRRAASDIAASRAGSARRLLTSESSRAARQLRVLDHDGRRVGEVGRIQALVIGGHVRGGYEHRRLSRGGDLEHRASRPRDDDVSRGEERPERRRPRQHAVVRRRSPGVLRELALAGDVDNREPGIGSRPMRPLPTG